MLPLAFLNVSKFAIDCSPAFCKKDHYIFNIKDISNLKCLISLVKIQHLYLAESKHTDQQFETYNPLNIIKSYLCKYLHKNLEADC